MASIKFYIKNPLDKNRKLRDKELSIYAVFTRSKKERFPITLDEKIFPRYWDFKNQQVKSTYRGHHEVNVYLSDFKTNLLKLYRDNRDMPFLKFKELALSRVSPEKKTLFLALDQFIEAYKLEKDSKTVAKYLTLQRHLILFDKETPIDFQTLDFNFYDRFKAYLLAIPNPFYRDYRLLPVDGSNNEFAITLSDSGDVVGIFDDNVYAYIIQLKTFLAWSQRRGYQVNETYKTWEVIRRVHPPISLTMAELERLESFAFTEDLIRKSVRPSNVGRVIDALNIARDYLVFECRTGQRISDVKRFQLRDYQDEKWTFTPRKGNRLTQKQISVHFKGYCAPALDILQRYNWKMPVISEQKLNDNIKTACKIAGIDSQIITYRWAGNKRIKIEGPKYEFLSTHSGRKSFITLALQAGLPVEYVMQLTGITEYKTINHYKAKFEDSMIEKYLTGIQDKAVMKKAQ